MSDLDLGPPTSYVAAAEGVPVLSSDGEEVGRLAHVLADTGADVFEGIVISQGRIAGSHRFADVSEVEGFYEGGVVLKLDCEAAERLPEPSENPAVMGAAPGEPAESELTRKLRAAWDRLTGNY